MTLKKFYGVAACSMILVIGISITLKTSMGQTEPSYVGDSSCLVECHTKEVNSFKESIHNKAFANIKDTELYLSHKEKGTEKDCFKCHTTGYGKKGGFIDEETTPDHAKVGCESCHGPGFEHIAANAKNTAKKKATITLKPDCTQCHVIHSDT